MKIWYYSSIIALLLPIKVLAADSVSGSIQASVHGMRVQSERLKVISQNIANSDVTGAAPGSDPYQRKQTIFKNGYDQSLKTDVVAVDKIIPDKSDFIKKYEPSHPAADKDGYVKYPNVNVVVETVDAKEAQRSFEANLSAYEIAKANQAKIIELMR
jgi:flagellar basal-body rod protein FlgC